MRQRPPKPDNPPVATRQNINRYHVAKVRIRPGEYLYGVWDTALRFWAIEPEYNRTRAETLCHNRNRTAY
jgi:hypothetical protein